MTSYSGYVEHSDFYIRPQSYQDAFISYADLQQRVMKIRFISEKP